MAARIVNQIKRLARRPVLSVTSSIHGVADKILTVNTEMTAVRQPRMQANRPNSSIQSRVFTKASLNRGDETLALENDRSETIGPFLTLGRIAISAAAGRRDPPDRDARFILVDSGLSNGLVIPKRLLASFDPAFQDEQAIEVFLEHHQIDRVNINGLPIGIRVQNIAVWLYATKRARKLHLRDDLQHLRLDIPGGVIICEEKEGSPIYKHATLGLTALIENDLSLTVNPDGDGDYKIEYHGPFERLGNG